MKKRSILFFLFIIFAAVRAAAQAEVKTEEKPFIEVTGTAEQNIVPNEIYIRITLQEKYESKEKLGLERQEEQLKTALKGAGINLDNMYLSDADAGYVKVRRKTGEVLTSKSFTLMVSKVPEVAKVFVELDRLDISNAEISRIDHSAIDSFRKETRIAAIKAAKNKADYLLAAIGQQTGKALIVQEKDSYSPQTGLNIQYKSNYMANTTLEGYAPSKGDDLRFEKMKITASVYVKFQIE